jgi:hypothetical protein
MKQFQNKISVVEKGKMYTPNTQTMIAWLGTGTWIKSGGVKRDLFA